MHKLVLALDVLLNLLHCGQAWQDDLEGPLLHDDSAYLTGVGGQVQQSDGRGVPGA